MKCPICGKDVELKEKQIGTDENGEPVFNEYAICATAKSSGILTSSARRKWQPRKRLRNRKKNP